MSNILVDLTPILPGGENGGAKPMVLELIRQLGMLAKKDTFILLTSLVSHEELAILDSINIRRFCVAEHHISAKNPLSHFTKRCLHYAKRKLRLKNLSKMEFLKQLKSDLLFCPFTAPTFFSLNIPVVSIIYDLQYIDYPYFFSVNEQLGRDENFQKACQAASYLVCISEFTRQKVLTHSHTALLPERVVTIPIYLPYAVMQNRTHDLVGLLQQYHLVNDDFLFYPANFWKHKNHKMLLVAFATYITENPLSTLKLVCTGAVNAGQEMLVSAVEKMGIKDRVIFPGYVAQEILLGFLSACKAVIFPSLYEGFGMPVIEAMLAGKPVLCSDRTALPEVAGKTAFYFDPRKSQEIVVAITQMENTTSNLLDEKIMSGYQHALNYLDSKKMAESYYQIFQKTMSSKPQYYNNLMGVFDDGWTEDKIVVTHNQAKERRTLEIVFQCPEWHPKASVNIRHNDKSFHLKASETLTISLPMQEESACLELNIDNTFQPSLCGLGEDLRILGCFVLGCDIVSENKRIKLWH